MLEGPGLQTPLCEKSKCKLTSDVAKTVSRIDHTIEHNDAADDTLKTACLRFTASASRTLARSLCATPTNMPPNLRRNEIETFVMSLQTRSPRDHSAKPQQTH